MTNKDDIAEEKNFAASAPGKAKALSDLLDQWELEMSKTAIPLAPVPSKRI